MKYLDTFTGIGGFTIPLQELGQECIGFSEIDPYAQSVYLHNFPTHKPYGDITKIITKDLPDFDIFTGGFPCQSFSIAGKRRGFEDTRGTMFFEIARIIREKQPRLLLLENVKGLLSHDKGRTFFTIISTLNELGYNAEWQVINSKHYGVPQNRERVFIIGHLRGSSRGEVLPIGVSSKKHNGKTDLEGCANTLTSRNAGGANRRGNYIIHNVYGGFKEGVREFRDYSPTIRTASGGGHIPNVVEYVALTEKRTEEAKKIRREIKDKDYCPRRGKYLAPREDGKANCVTANQGKEHYLYNGKRVRRLTPIECERLQGFPDNWTKYGKDGEEISDTQRYKMCGNAVTVNVTRSILNNLIKE